MLTHEQLALDAQEQANLAITHAAKLRSAIRNNDPAAARAATDAYDAAIQQRWEDWQRDATSVAPQSGA